MINLIRTGEISKRFLYTFSEVFTRLAFGGELKFDGGQEMIATELKRLIRRATREEKRSDENVQQQIEGCVKKLVGLLNKLKFSGFSSYLEIMNFIAREGKTDAALS